MLGRKSPWGEYLQHIIALEDLPIPAYWSKADRELLNGTSLEERIAEMDEGLQEEYDTTIVPFLTDSTISCPKEKLSFEVYKVPSLPPSFFFLPSTFFLFSPISLVPFPFQFSMKNN